jgi:hypothetical protein
MILACFCGSDIVRELIEGRKPGMKGDLVYNNCTLIPVEQAGSWHVVIQSAKFGYKQTTTFPSRDEAIGEAKRIVDARGPTGMNAPRV